MMPRIEKVKNHLKKNKKIYIAGAAGVVAGAVVGAVGIWVYASRNGANIAMVDSMKLTLINWKSPHTSQTVQVVLPQLGHPGNAVQCLENGTVYASQGAAARALDVNPVAVVRHLQGKQESVAGKHLIKITEAGVPVLEMAAA